MAWRPCNAFARAKWGFKPQAGSHLRLAAGDRVEILHYTDEWYFGRRVQGEGSGIFPAEYVEIVDAPGALVQRTVSRDDLLQRDIESILREWSQQLRRLLAGRDVEEYMQLRRRMKMVSHWRARASDPSVPPPLRSDAKSSIVKIIEASRQIMRGFMLPRTSDGSVADESNTNVIELLRMVRAGLQGRTLAAFPPADPLAARGQHVKLQRRIRAGVTLANTAAEEQMAMHARQSALVYVGGEEEERERRTAPSGGDGQGAEEEREAAADEEDDAALDGEVQRSAAGGSSPWAAAEAGEAAPGVAGASQLHILLEHRMAAFEAAGATELYFSLWSATADQWLSEEFRVVLTPHGMPASVGGAAAVGSQTTASSIARAAARSVGPKASEHQIALREAVAAAASTGKGSRVGDPTLMNSLKAVFTNLAPHEVQDGLYLVCRVYTRSSGAKVAPPQQRGALSAMVGALKHGASGSSSVDGGAADGASGRGESTNWGNGGGGKGPGASGEAGGAEEAREEVEEEVTLSRRLYGVACTPLSSVLASIALNTEFTPEQFVLCAPAGGDPRRFATLHRAIIRGERSAYEVVSRALPLAVTLRLLYGPLRSCRERTFANELKGAFDTPRLTLSDKLSPNDARHDLYITLNHAAVSQDKKKTARNVEVRVMVVLDTGGVQRALVRGTGPQEELFSVYTSCTHYHTNTPVFDETLRIRLSPARLERSHVLFLLYHLSTYHKDPLLFSYGFLPLGTERGVMREDGTVDLPCYAPTAEVFESLSPSGSQRAPWAGGVRPRYLRGPDTGGSPLQAREDRLSVSVRLCSTQATQHVALKQLLEWRTLDNARLSECLTSVAHITSQETLNFLQEVLDALAGILVRVRDSGVEPRAFDLLVRLLHRLRDSARAFMPVLRAHLRQGFRSERLHAAIFRHLHRVLDPIGGGHAESDGDVGAPGESLEEVERVVCCLPLLVRLIRISRRQDELQATPSVPKAAFEEHCLSLFASLNRLMEAPADRPGLGRIQALALKRVAPAFAELRGALAPELVGQCVQQFLAAVERGPVALHPVKLLFVRELARGAVLSNRASRPPALAACLRVLQGHLNRSPDERSVAVDVLLQLVRVVEIDHAPEGVWSLAQLLPDVLLAVRDLQCHGPRVSTLPEAAADVAQESAVTDLPTPRHLFGVPLVAPASTHRDSAELSDASVCLLAIVHLLHEDQLMRFAAEALGSAERRRGFFTLLLSTLRHMLGSPIFPDSWLSLVVFQRRVAVKVIRWTRRAAEGDLTGDGRCPSPEVPLWMALIEFALCAASVAPLHVEACDSAVRGFVEGQNQRMQLPSDLRLLVVEELRAAWSGLRGSADQFSELASACLPQALSPCAALASLSTDLYLDILRGELRQPDDPQQVTARTIDAMDAIVQRDQGPAFLELFDGLRKKARELIGASGERFASTMVDMYGYLTAVHRFQAAAKAKGQDKAVQAEANEDERALAVLRLVDHLREAGKPHMAAKYLLLLAGWQEELGNTAEAGMVVADLARSLQWSEHLVPAAAAGTELYPVEPSRVRREKLYRRAADLLAQGGALEESAVALRELSRYLRDEAYRYAELGVLLRREASLFDTVTGLERLPCTFFLVTPYGAGVAASVGAAPFVFKGQPLERASSFAERLARKFPAATILRQPKVDVEALREAEGLTLHVLLLMPVPGEGLDHVLAAHAHGQEVGDKVRRNRAAYTEHLQRLRRMPPPQAGFYRHTRVRVFAVQRPVRKRKSKSDNEFLDLWVVVRYVEVENVFPSLTRRATVVREEEVEMNPLENAVYAMQTKNEEVHLRIREAELVGDREAPQSFTMMINGIVDAAVSGGVANYRTFFDGQYAETHPEIAEDVNRTPSKKAALDALRDALREQLAILGRGIEVHAVKCAEEMLPLHEHLAGRFTELRSMLASLGVQ